MTLPSLRFRLLRGKSSAILIFLYFFVNFPSLGQKKYEFQPNSMTRSIKLNAIARSDNGKNVGMSVVIGRSYLKYHAFKGKLELSYYGKFDLGRLPPKFVNPFARAMRESEIYRIENANEFVAANPENLLTPKGTPPTFVTILKGLYVDGGTAIWICILSSPSIEFFYQNALGHERCDAFRE